ncbi:MAG: hypothetical protein AUI53_05045 [Acidobacteria bacterium 13_1_40CM_2_60_7]|nr:MAG: hypothetical protein AUI53_05045 [Acidobacteria bacterium 13_1_40CM_2_60_7]PYU04017.1 MAG: hypothetical protein DMG33_15250 [Acidobacteriota bacterium]
MSRSLYQTLPVPGSLQRDPDSNAGHPRDEVSQERRNQFASLCAAAKRGMRLAGDAIKRGVSLRDPDRVGVNFMCDRPDFIGVNSASGQLHV